MHKCSIDLILYKYCIPSVKMRASNIKEHVETLVDGAYKNGKIQFC